MYEQTVWVCHWVNNYSIMSMFACINEWTLLHRRTKIAIIPVPVKSLLRHLAPIKCINISKHTKNLRFSLDTTYIYISTINTIPCNTDIKVFGHISQICDRG